MSKHSLGEAYNTSRKVLSVTDRAHALLSKGYNAIGDQLEPEVRQRVGGALQAYARRRQTIESVDANVRQIGADVRQAYPEYIA